MTLAFVELALGVLVLLHAVINVLNVVLMNAIVWVHLWRGIVLVLGDSVANHAPSVVPHSPRACTYASRQFLACLSIYNNFVVTSSIVKYIWPEHSRPSPWRTLGSMTTCASVHRCVVLPSKLTWV